MNCDMCYLTERGVKLKAEKVVKKSMIKSKARAMSLGSVQKICDPIGEVKWQSELEDRLPRSAKIGDKMLVKARSTYHNGRDGLNSRTCRGELNKTNFLSNNRGKRVGIPALRNISLKGGRRAKFEARSGDRAGNETKK